jgi:hypothetical protein
MLADRYKVKNSEFVSCISEFVTRVVELQRCPFLGVKFVVSVQICIHLQLIFEPASKGVI